MRTKNGVEIMADDPRAIRKPIGALARVPLGRGYSTDDCCGSARGTRSAGPHPKRRRRRSCAGLHKPPGVISLDVRARTTDRGRPGPAHLPWSGSSCAKIQPIDGLGVAAWGKGMRLCRKWFRQGRQRFRSYADGKCHRRRNAGRATSRRQRAACDSQGAGARARARDSRDGRAA